MERVNHVQHVPAPDVLPGNRVEERLGVVRHHVDLVGQRRVEEQVRPVLVGRDVQPLAPAHVLPHGEGVHHLRAPEVHVPHAPAGQPYPRRLEHRFALPQHVGAGREVDFERLRVPRADVVVQRVDALVDGHLVRAQPQRRTAGRVAHLPNEVKLRNQHLLAPGERHKVLVQQLHVHALRGLQIVLPRRRPGRMLRVPAGEVVVHGDGVRVDALAQQRLPQFQRGGRLPRARGTRQQHNRAAAPVGDDGVRRVLHLSVEALVRHGHELLGVFCHDIDFFQLKCHTIHLF